VKRIFDFTLALLLSPFVLVICLLVAGPVALECRASPFFFQRRLGMKERPFWLLKLRTMHVSTPHGASHEVGLSAVLRSGRLLRRLKIDELPQIWNILIGTMSFVGPRPGLPSQTELTAERRRHGVFDLRPGVTGPAQIRGIDMSTPVRLAEVDSSYAGPWSLWRDLHIILATATGSGSGDAAAVDMGKRRT
jgi:O-antigen biosynthesis protein WbqP